ncbi:MAG: hypothetical protein R2792_15805 [Saprospiraceae bacterium]
MNFKIHENSANGSIVFEESQSGISDVCGLFQMKSGAKPILLDLLLLTGQAAANTPMTVNGITLGTTELLSVLSPCMPLIPVCRQGLGLKYFNVD